MNKIFLSINTQFENLGDALINRELIRLLVESGDVFVDIKGVPEWFVEMLELPEEVVRLSGRGRLLCKAMKEILLGNKVYYFFMPGGASGNISFSVLVKKIMLLFPFFALKFMGVRFCNVGLSYERLGSNYKIFLKTRSWIMHKMFVRDNESSLMLDKMGIKHSGVLPDLAFNMFMSLPQDRERLGAVCFSFRTDQYPAQLDDCYYFICRVLRNLTGRVKVVCAVQVDRDLKGMRVIQKRLEDKGVSVEFLHESRDIRKMSSLYEAVDVVVSNRLHVLLLAASVSRRVLAYVDSTNKKISGLFETVGRSDLLVGAGSSESKIKKALSAPVLCGRRQYENLREGMSSVFQ